MALYGDNLASTIRQGTTWRKGREVCDIVAGGLRGCYASLSLWDDWKAHGTVDAINLAFLQVISPDDAGNMKAMLDDELARNFSLAAMISDRIDEFGEDGEMSEDYLDVLRGRTKTATDTIALCDKLFHTSVGSQVSDAVVPVVGDLADVVANAVSKVVGNVLAGVWWIIALAALGFLAYRRYVKA
jgi:hypothetical protein